MLKLTHHPSFGRISTPQPLNDKRLYAVSAAKPDDGVADNPSIKQMSLKDLAPPASNIKLCSRLVAKYSEGSGTGIYASESIGATEELLRLPRSSLLIAQNDEKSPWNQLPDAAWNNIPLWGKLALKLVEATGPHQSSHSSQLQVYLSHLPESIDLPAYWSDNDLQQFQDPILHQEVEEMQEEWRRIYALASPFLDHLGEGGTKDRLFWAISIVLSRSFKSPKATTPLQFKALLLITFQAIAVFQSQFFPDVPWSFLTISLSGLFLSLVWTLFGLVQYLDSSQEELCLFPILDIFNHSCRVKKGCYLDLITGDIVFNSPDHYDPGHQVYSTYGNLSNSELIVNYGFIDENANDTVRIPGLVTLLSDGPLGDACGGPQLFFEAVDRCQERKYLNNAWISIDGISSDAEIALERMIDSVKSGGSNNFDAGKDFQSAPLYSSSSRSQAKLALKVAIKQLLKQLPTSLEEDEYELMHLTNQSTRQKLWLNYRISRKRLLKQWLETEL